MRYIFAFSYFRLLAHSVCYRDTVLDEFEVLEIIIDELHRYIELMSLEDDGLMIGIDMTVEGDLVIQDE